MKRKTNIVHSIASITIAGILILQITEFFGNPDALKSRIFFSTTLILGITTSIALILRIKGLFSLPALLYKAILGITIGALLCTIVATWLDYKNGANFVYGILRLNYDRLYYVAFFSSIILLLQQPTSWYRKWYRYLLFFTPLIVLIYLFPISLWHLDKLAQLVKEDHIIEYSQFFMLVFGSISAIKLARVFHHNKLVATLLTIAACILIVVGGDEISWGQRIFGIETPASLTTINTQQETTIHNLKGIINYVNLGYIILGMYGTFAYHIEHVVHRYINKKHTSLLIPSPHLSLFFLLPFLFNLYIALGDHHIGQWAEVMELFLYSGITIFIMENYFLNRKNTL